MSQYLPKDGFHCYEGNNSVENMTSMLSDMDNNSSVGMVLEVDVSYLKNLHDAHNDLPFLPEKMTPSGS